MQCCNELIAPTAVTHAISMPFVGPTANNLIVAKNSLLQVFKLRDTHNAGSDGSGANSKLILIGEYPLSGTVTSLQRVKTLNTKSGGEAVLVAVRDAKLSLVEWDPENHRINTVSIHYYEGDNVISQPFGPNLGDCESVLTVDPDQYRCAALKFGQRHLAILPFRQIDQLGLGEDEGLDSDMADLQRTRSRAEGDVSTESQETPYRSSFVLPLTSLDPAVTHCVHLAALYDYREPALGILSAPVEPSSALVEERKDILNFNVFTLDLEQKASTNLISVQKLPSDLWKVVPLQPPVGGALLIGTNELVHVDQSGKTNAVAVNEFARQSSGLSMADQSSLNMKLEGCEVQQLDAKSGDMLIVLNTGELAVLNFKMLGRSIGGLHVTRVPVADGGAVIEGSASCMAPLPNSNCFVGSEDGDSVLVHWSRQGSTLSRKRSHAQMLDQQPAEEEDEEAEDVDEDDLYATVPEPVKRSTSPQQSADATGSYVFEVVDRLPSLAPINNVCFGKSMILGKNKLELVAATGRGRASRLAFMNRELVPELGRVTEFKSARSAWCVAARAKGAEMPEYDTHFFAYDGQATRIYSINEPPNINKGDITASSPSLHGYKELTGTEFEAEGETSSIATLAGGTRIVQVRRTEVRTYDSDLGLSQIIPMLNEETDEELNIIHTSFRDPYLLMLREDSSVQIMQVLKSGDVEPLDDEKTVLQEKQWLSGCLYSGSLTGDKAVAFLLDENGGLNALSLPDLQPVYTAATLPYLPPVLTADAPLRRGYKETLTELLVVDIGQEELTQPFMVLRSATDDLTLYEPFHYPPDTTATPGSWHSCLRFRKVPFSYVPKYDESAMEIDGGRPAPFKAVSVGEYSAVSIPGPSPSLILKEAANLPKVLGMRAKNVKALMPMHRSGCEQGFATLSGDGGLRECRMPAETSFGTGWSVRRERLGEPLEEVRHIAYHEERGMYVVATCRDVDFLLSEDDGRKVEQDDISLRPQIPQYTLHLLSSKTRRLIHSFEMPYTEAITSLKVMTLEVSEHTREQKLMVVVGTASLRGEDMPAKGAVVVFDILDVVPEPDVPESGYKLHVISREEPRGAITAVESFPGGLVGTAQGQKIMIRGLKEDGSCLPVAFLDAQCMFTTLKVFGKSGLWLAGDAWKGLWFGGFTQEPYKLTVLGKSRSKMEVVAADFLPFEGQLYLIVVDADMDLHVLQYDPESPKSLSGTRLLHRSTFHLGQWPTSMSLLPSTLAPFSEQQALTNGQHRQDESDGSPNPEPPSLFHLLITSQDGAIDLITPVDEGTYRRLGSLETRLTSILEHPAGLNPRAYRAVTSEGFGARGIIDGSLVQRIGELGAARRAEVLGQAGGDAWQLRSDSEIVGGGGLGYL